MKRLVLVLAVALLSFPAFADSSSGDTIENFKFTDAITTIDTQQTETLTGSFTWDVNEEITYNFLFSLSGDPFFQTISFGFDDRGNSFDLSGPEGLYSLSFDAAGANLRTVIDSNDGSFFGFPYSNDYTSDFAFTSQTDVPLPEPGSLAFLFAGLLSLSLLRHGNRRAVPR